VEERGRHLRRDEEDKNGEADVGKYWIKERQTRQN
jgi:hypothetical protein